MNEALKGPREDYELAYEMASIVGPAMDKAIRKRSLAEAHQALADDARNPITRSFHAYLADHHDYSALTEKLAAKHAADHLDPTIAEAERRKKENAERLGSAIQEKLDGQDYIQLHDEVNGADIRLFRMSDTYAPFRLEAQIAGEAHGKSQDLFVTGDYSLVGSGGTQYAIRPFEAKKPWLEVPDSRPTRSQRIGQVIASHPFFGGASALSRPWLNIDRSWTGIVGDIALSEDLPEIISQAEPVDRKLLSPTYLSEYVQQIDSDWLSEPAAQVAA